MFHRRANRNNKTPWWVRALTTGGRPVVAVMVLIMCAPGEHHLAVLAGWNTRLAWGMAGVLAAYAGIAAAVASNRPAGAPGKRSAVIGAWCSLAAAMSAQPVSHLFVTGHLTAEPRPPVWLVVAVSCVPPLVLGHLLHLAATPAAPHATPADAPPPPTGSEPTPASPSAPEPATDVQQLDAAIEEAMRTVAEDTETVQLLSVADVAALKGVAEGTVRSWVSRNKLQAQQRDADGRLQFHPAAVAALD